MVVGGGIVGLATARAVQQHRPDGRVGVLEKEPEVAHHQTGHNSGVIHSGIYYRPGSLKARLTMEGRRRLLAFCDEEKIPTVPVGKLVVAANPSEGAVLDRLESQAAANGVPDVRRLSGAEIQDRVPGLVGSAALSVPSASIVDYRLVAQRLAANVVASGGAVLTSAEVRAVRSTPAGWSVDSAAGSVDAAFIVNCAGLQSDLLAERMGAVSPVAIIPFRGDFYRLRGTPQARVHTLVYPVPNPALPFLGVHLTPTVRGELLAGPNAAIALDREGYRPGRFTLNQLTRLASYPGSWRLLRRYGSIAATEGLRSWAPAEFLAAIRRLMPSVGATDLAGRTSGVRAQAVRRDGSLEDDFVLVKGERSLHVVNAPSPAATASFAIAEHVVAQAGLASAS